MIKNLREWVSGELVPEFFIEHRWFEIVIPLPFWKALALIEVVLIVILYWSSRP